MEMRYFKLSAILTLLLIIHLAGSRPSAWAEERAYLKNGHNLTIQNHQTQANRMRLNITDSDFIEMDPVLIDHFEPVVPSISLASEPTRVLARELPSDNASQPLQIQPAIKEVAKKYSLDHKLITAMIRAESNFNPYALSPKGAQGLMQLMPGTALQMKVSNAYDIRENLEAGARYLKQLLDNYQNDLALALAAYNAGPVAVSLYRGIPPFPETREYIQKVLYGRLMVP
jgi:soluble lytic murein transglycosylase-like protein